MPDLSGFDYSYFLELRGARVVAEISSHEVFRLTGAADREGHALGAQAARRSHVGPARLPSKKALTAGASACPEAYIASQAETRSGRPTPFSARTSRSFAPE